MSLWALVYRESSINKWLMETGDAWLLEDGSYWLLEH